MGRAADAFRARVERSFIKVHSEVSGGGRLRGRREDSSRASWEGRGEGGKGRGDGLVWERGGQDLALLS